MPPTILIADDDTELCELLREYLGQEGFDVRLAFDGEQALAESRRPGVDAMVLDIMMPRMNGIDVLRNLRKESELPVIMLTARGDDLDRIITSLPGQTCQPTRVAGTYPCNFATLQYPVNGGDT